MKKDFNLQAYVKGIKERLPYYKKVIQEAQLEFRGSDEKFPLSLDISQLTEQTITFFEHALDSLLIEYEFDIQENSLRINIEAGQSADLVENIMAEKTFRQLVLTTQSL